jgi:DNA-3-methyladenine glycosylase II
MTSSSGRQLLTRESLNVGVRALKRKDRALGQWMERIGTVPLRRQRHQFGALCRAILSQQVAAAAARTIHTRFLATQAPARNPTPQGVLQTTEVALRACGISGRKARYLHALAQAFDDGPLAGVRLSRLDDPEVVARLTEVPGVGVWTAEMFLIFSLGRADVFSVGDLALRTGVQRVVGRNLEASEIEQVAERWSPHRSVASLYLWKIAHY